MLLPIRFMYMSVFITLITLITLGKAIKSGLGSAGGLGRRQTHPTYHAGPLPTANPR